MCECDWTLWSCLALAIDSREHSFRRTFSGSDMLSWEQLDLSNKGGSGRIASISCGFIDFLLGFQRFNSEALLTRFSLNVKRCHPLFWPDLFTAAYIKTVISMGNIMQMALGGLKTLDRPSSPNSLVGSRHCLKLPPNPAFSSQNPCPYEAFAVWVHFVLGSVAKWAAGYKAEKGGKAGLYSMVMGPLLSGD